MSVGSPTAGTWSSSQWRLDNEFETDRFGSSQTTVLAWLVRHTRATDATLRQAAGVASNKQLAGILSGLSKQAAACHLSAREVFTIENESKAGETTKTYVIARYFRDMATANNSNR